MMGYWWLFLLGLLGGWLIELAIDYTWWRKRHRAAAVDAARRLGEIEQFRKDVESREARLALRERDAGERETVQSGRDADLLLQAKRIDERGEAILRAEQRLEARRAEIEKLAATLGDRDRASGERLHVIQQAETRFADRQSRLDAADVEAAKREAMLGSRESGIKRWEQRILTKEKELHGLEAEAARAARDAERWRRQYHGMRALIDQRYRREDGADDLSIIQGVNRRAETLLNGLGVTSFVRLAETPLGELSRLAEQGGPDLALADPMSWAEQAALLVDRDFIGFETLKAKLRGDVPAGERIAATDIALESGPPTEGDDAQAGAEAIRADQPRAGVVEAERGEPGEDEVLVIVDAGPAEPTPAAVEPGSVEQGDEGERGEGGEGGGEAFRLVAEAEQKVAVDEPRQADTALTDVDGERSDVASTASAGRKPTARRARSAPAQLHLDTESQAAGPSAADLATMDDANEDPASGQDRPARSKGRAARLLKAPAAEQALDRPDPPAEARENATDSVEADQEAGASQRDAEAVWHDEALAVATHDIEADPREAETIVPSATAPAGQAESAPGRRPERPPFSGQPSRGGGRRRRR